MSLSLCSHQAEFCCHAATQSHSIIVRSIKRCGYPGRRESCLSFRLRRFLFFFLPIFFVSQQLVPLTPLSPSPPLTPNLFPLLPLLTSPLLSSPLSSVHLSSVHLSSPLLSSPLLSSLLLSPPLSSPPLSSPLLSSPLLSSPLSSKRSQRWWWRCSISGEILAGYL